MLKCDRDNIIQLGQTSKTWPDNQVTNLTYEIEMFEFHKPPWQHRANHHQLGAQKGLLLTSTIPWLMVPYCLFLSITRLMTMTVAMATAMTNSPMRALLLRLKSSRRGPTDSYSNRTDVRQGLGDSARRETCTPGGSSSWRVVTLKTKGAPRSRLPSNHPHKENSHFSQSPWRS